MTRTEKRMYEYFRFCCWVNGVLGILIAVLGLSRITITQSLDPTASFLVIVAFFSGLGSLVISIEPDVELQMIAEREQKQVEEERQRARFKERVRLVLLGGPET